jgi:hypothetical protein
LKGHIKKNNYPKNVYLNSTLGFELENTPIEAYLRYLLVMNAKEIIQAYNVENNGKMKKST